MYCCLMGVLGVVRRIVMLAGVVIDSIPSRCADFILLQSALKIPHVLSSYDNDPWNRFGISIRQTPLCPALFFPDFLFSYLEREEELINEFPLLHYLESEVFVD